MLRIIAFALLLLSPLLALASPEELERGLEAFRAKDYQGALAIWAPLAEQGDRDALFNVALLYDKGLGVPRSPRNALNLYLAAAKQGQVEAQYNLGMLYTEGKGVFRSDQAAVKWWQQAVDAGYTPAMFNLGVMYAYGRGVKQSGEKAVELWTRAADSGNRDAVGALIGTYEKGMFGIAPNPAKRQEWEAKLKGAR